MQDLNDLFFYARVVEHGGFAPAGRALGVPKSTLSRRISLLEERLGARLLQRSSRRFAMTEIGQVYYRHCAAMIAEAEAAQEAVDQLRAEPRGTVRVTCPVSLMRSHVSVMVSRFLAAYPRVHVQLSATNRRVDVIEEGVDVALRVRFPPLESAGLVMRKLADSNQLVVASPTLLDKVGRPTTPAELNRFDGLDLVRTVSTSTWDLTRSDGLTASIGFEPRFLSDDMVALRDAAEAGVGIVQLPDLLVRNQIGAGTLETVLPDWRPKTGIIHAVFPSRRGLSPTVRSFVDFLVREFAREEAAPL